MASKVCSWARFQRHKCIHLSVLATLCIVSYFAFRKIYTTHNGLTVDKLSNYRIAPELRRVRDDLLSVYDTGDNSVSVNNRNTLKSGGIDVIIPFTKANEKKSLQSSLKQLVKSILRFSSEQLVFHIIGDEQSSKIATTIFAEMPRNVSAYRVIHHNITGIAEKMDSLIREMQKYFSYKPGAYFSDALFFIAIAIHRVMFNLEKVIILDVDLKFRSDIKILHQMFDQFLDSNMIGLAWEQQPVYRHLFYQYRASHKDTRVGEPPPHGLTGFNSGVVLLDLQKMRKSGVYNLLLTSGSLKSLTEKYMFKGHLGDQDFFTLISMDHENLFYVLPCTWNRQLCQWWKKHGYEDIADSYHQCEGHINVYHGNCNTPFPEDNTD